MKIVSSLKSLRKRDSNGLHKKARNGVLKHITGIFSPYEKPFNCKINLNSEKLSPPILVNEVISYVKKHQII
jgi:adenylylsulfate kinase-like enzyme